MSVNVGTASKIMWMSNPMITAEAATTLADAFRRQSHVALVTVTSVAPRRTQTSRPAYTPPP